MTARPRYEVVAVKNAASRSTVNDNAPSAVVWGTTIKSTFPESRMETEKMKPDEDPSKARRNPRFFPNRAVFSEGSELRSFLGMHVSPTSAPARYDPRAK